MLDWLRDRVGPPGHPLPDGPEIPTPDPAPLPELGVAVSTDPADLLLHARGQGLPDIVRLRTGRGVTLPDGVCRPTSAAEVEGVLAVCAAAGVRVVPWGGGTSVTGGVNILAGDRPVVSMDLGRLAGLQAVDEVSGLATFGPGTAGPEVESALAEHALTLGHFPQSFELSTVGGWAAARSSGQESLGYGRIEDMVAGLELVAPRGRLRLPALPASAAGPDLRHLVMGSEGRMGVITEVTLRVRPRPEVTAVEAALLPDLEPGLEVIREVVGCGLPLTVIRLSDAPETQVAMAVGLAASSAAPLVRGYLRLRGVGEDGCLLLYGSAGRPEVVTDVLGCARSVIRRHRGVVLGRRPGRHWAHDRFRHPYLREELLALGWATDTLETAVPWSRVTATRERVGEAIRSALADADERVAVLCHVSHPYRDGASLYFTLFFRPTADPDETIARWAATKRVANQALMAAGATLSHHHGIGQWHAPWLEAEVGERGRALLAAAARELDPDGILNPHVLLEPVDRLEA
jgi:alkyldihydroxyacetonephosphate synthase